MVQIHLSTWILEIKDITFRTRCWILTPVLSFPVSRIPAIKAFKQINTPIDFSDLGHRLRVIHVSGTLPGTNTQEYVHTYTDKKLEQMLSTNFSIDILIITKFLRDMELFLYLWYFLVKNPLFRTASYEKAFFPAMLNTAIRSMEHPLTINPKLMHLE